MEPDATGKTEPHWTEDAEKRRKLTRLLGWIFLGLGLLQLFVGDWLYAVFLLAYSLFLLSMKRFERLPKAVQYLLTAAFAVFGVLLFVKMVSDLSSLR